MEMGSLLDRKSACVKKEKLIYEEDQKEWG